MSGLSPVPPPLPQNKTDSKSQNNGSYEENTCNIPCRDLYNIIYLDILRKCDLLDIKINTKSIWMTPIPSYLQVGPTCGLAIICMLSNSIRKHLNLTDLLKICQQNGFTKFGEMFSVQNMKSMCDQVFTQFQIQHRLLGLKSDEQLIINEIKDGAVLFVPYDADYNHDPCLKNGTKAHWALVFGLIETATNEIYLLARQGKSKYIGIWSLDELSNSNANLFEIDTTKLNGEYVIPSNGIKQGLCKQFLILKPNEKIKTDLQ